MSNLSQIEGSVERNENELELLGGLSEGSLKESVEKKKKRARVEKMLTFMYGQMEKAQERMEGSE